jgi:hypothetical protein
MLAKLRFVMAPLSPYIKYWDRALKYATSSSFHVITSLSYITILPRVIKSRRMRWVGHIEEMRNA